MLVLSPGIFQIAGKNLYKGYKVEKPYVSERFNWEINAPISLECSIILI